MLNKIFANREMRILMLGLDAAGKTSISSFTPFTCHKETEKLNCAIAILYKLKLNQQYVRLLDHY